MSHDINKAKEDNAPCETGARGDHVSKRKFWGLSYSTVAQETRWTKKKTLSVLEVVPCGGE